MTWVPPYLGSWEQLVKALLHNPFLGGGGGPHFPHKSFSSQARARISDDSSGAALTSATDSSRFAADPQPQPWRSEATSVVLTVLGLKEAAAKIPDDRVRRAYEENLTSVLSAFLDDYCGNSPPHYPFPWPGPGPGPWTYALAGELALAANSLREGVVQTGALGVATNLLERMAGEN